MRARHLLRLALLLTVLLALVSCFTDKREAQRKEAERLAIEKERAELEAKLREQEKRLSELPHPAPPTGDEVKRRELQRALDEERARLARSSRPIAPRAPRPPTSARTPCPAGSADPLTDCP